MFGFFLKYDLQLLIFNYAFFYEFRFSTRNDIILIPSENPKEIIPSENPKEIIP